MTRASNKCKSEKRAGSLLIVLLLTISFTLGACGRKGGLFMPEAKDSAASSQEETQSEKKEKDKRQSDTK